MSTTPEAPEPQEGYSQESASVPRWVAVVFVVVFVLVGYLLYAGHTSRKALEAEVAKANQRADLLAAQIEQVNTRLADLKGQLEVTSDKLGLTQ